MLCCVLAVNEEEEEDEEEEKGGEAKERGKRDAMDESGWRECQEEVVLGGPGGADSGGPRGRETTPAHPVQAAAW